MADVRSVTNILGEFYSLNYDNEELRPLFDSNDIGFPLAYHIWSGLAEPTDRSVQYLNQTWLEFCAIYDIDPMNNFDTLDEFINFNDSVE